ncbi:MAG: type II secretion system protein GspD [Gammaproteobacteria bacterium]|nr:MAG: type II secretion system protein GspD [Gammaproteobacteria bacterium]
MALLLSSFASAQEYTVNLKDTDIQELIKFVAEVTDTTIVVDPAVKGKVKVVSAKPVRKDELYQLFLSILEVHGYTAVRSGSVVRVIPSKEARSSAIEIRDKGSALNNDEYVTQVIRLENISAAKLIPVLRPLVPQQAHMAAYAPSNAIIISDTGANIARIRGVIERMDKSARQETQVVKLRYGVASDIVSMLEKLQKSEGQKRGVAQKSVLLVPDNRTNSVLISGDEMERARLRKLIYHLDKPLEQNGNIKVIYLEYANAKDVAEVLGKVLQGMSKLNDGNKSAGSAKASIEAEEGTNALIITADAGEMAALEAVVQRLDIRRAQVLVEAIIVELSSTNGKDLGLEWVFAKDNGAFGSNINVSKSSRTSSLGSSIFDKSDDSDDNSTDEFNTNALLSGLAGVGGTTLGWGTVSDDLSLAVILNALQQQTNANVLSTPSLLTLDNEEATITVGQEVPFVTGSYTSTGNNASNPFQTVTRENVGVILKVTPHINDGDSVVLDIEQEVSSVSETATGSANGPTTNERKIQTKVLATDGATVVLGGLISDNVQEREQKVPILGDIPLLGRLFRTDSVGSTKTNLLVFIRPVIIRDETQLEGATAEKYRHIREQQILRKERGLMFLDDSHVPVLPEWEQDLRELERIRDEAAKSKEMQR